jgi:fatty acid desaturase
LANQTLIGRLLLGPFLVAGAFFLAEARRVAGGDGRRAALWLCHGIGVAAVLAWVVLVCGMPVGVYLVAFCYPGLSLTLMRSFAEHRAGPAGDTRTAVVEAGPLFSLLYLNNNLHLAHHEQPGVPWYRLPAASRTIEAPQRAAAGAGRFSGYGDVARRYLVRPVFHPAHPTAL